jgi:hypothetical protein
MRASRVLMIGISARVAVIGSLAAAATIVVATTAVATGTIGSLATTPTPCAGPYDTVQATSTGASYTVPAGGGAITAWSTQAGANTGSAALEVWRPTAVAGSYLLVGASPVAPLTASTLNSFTLATPISVQAGDLLGLRFEGSVGCGQSTANAGDTYGYALGTTAPAAGATVAMRTATNFLLNVTATVGAVAPPPPPPPPPTKDDCKDGGWQQQAGPDGQAFNNQGDCVSSFQSSQDDSRTSSWIDGQSAWSGDGRSSE